MPQPTLVIEPLLAALGWAGDYLPPVNMSGGRREDVPDMLLFRDAAAKAAAIAKQREDRRLRHGLAILEANALAASARPRRRERGARPGRAVVSNAALPEPRRRDVRTPGR